MLVPDTVHPNAEGYSFYAAEMQRFMETALQGEGKKCVQYALPEQYNSILRDSARLEDAVLAHRDGFFVREESMCGRYPHYIEGERGASLTLEFFGDTIGLYWIMAEDSGDIEYSVDGSEWGVCRAWDDYCLRCRRVSGVILASGLDQRMHTLTLRVCSGHAEKSLGTVIRIGAFLVN